MSMKGLIGAAGLALAAGMSAFHYTMPAAMGSRSTPTFERQPVYDGDGKKVRPKVHPRHNAKRSRTDWAAFRAKVLATHSFYQDPRDDKYLHSTARWARAERAVADLRRAIEAA